MTLRILCVLIAIGLHSIKLMAQQNLYARQIIAELCSAKYKGRGYVDNGVNIAADFLSAEFAKLNLKPFQNSFQQSYSFQVNTHPFPISCTLDKKEKIVGKDFLVNASSTSISGQFNLIHFNLKDSLEKVLLFKKIRKGFRANEAPVLHFAGQRNSHIEDSCKYYLHIPTLLIYTEEKKLTHSIARNPAETNSLTFIDSAIQNVESIEISFKNQLIEKFENQNVIGHLRAKKSDSFIVFTAHYDHLGMQGKAMFPGASDNASGTAMVLELAQYFSGKKLNYNMVFILFSGEEAGLLGSQYFTEHPLFDISKIKMLINIDIMGSAENGITVVNGEVFDQQFKLLQSLNHSKKYLPEVKVRGKTKNSDHYHFSEKGIPSFFIYSMGGPGFYHDVFDTAASVPLINFDAVKNLLIDFTDALTPTKSTGKSKKRRKER